MTSPSPLQYNTYYHIYNRGTNGENIFLQERNYQYFLSLLDSYIVPVAHMLAYCMLRNHFHMLVHIRSEAETSGAFKRDMRRRLERHPAKGQEVGLAASFGSEPDRARYPSKKFSDFFNAYAKGINRGYGRTGSLFEHPFGRVPIANNRQLGNVVTYIHQNPQKHNFVRDFQDWKYSSYGVILSERHTNLRRSEVLEWFGGRQGYLDHHAEWITDAQCYLFAQDDPD